MPAGPLRETPTTGHPLPTSRSAMLCPLMPVTPTTRARAPCIRSGLSVRRDEDLDLVALRVDQHVEAVGYRLLERRVPGDDLLDRQRPGGNLRGDSREVEHAITPRPDDGQVVLGPGHRRRRGRADVQAGLHDRPVL